MLLLLFWRPLDRRAWLTIGDMAVTRLAVWDEGDT